jgi:splicing suppressor protein 51
MESFLGLDTKSMLTNLPEERVYTFLIDSYRLRMEDEHMYRGDVDEDSLYGGGNPLKGFARFLKRAEKRDGVLPKWWSEEKRKGCIAKGDAEDHWSCLHVSVDKEDVIEHYNNGMAPMQLRMLAEEILGSNVMNG